MIKIINILIVCVIIFSILILSLIEHRFSYKQKKLIIIIYTIILSGFLMVRDIGLDLEPHRQLFNQTYISDINIEFFKNLFSNRVEPFNSLLITFIKNIGIGFEFYLLILGALSLGISAKIILKIENKNVLKLYSIFILIYFMSGAINIIRQFLACSLYLSAIYSLSEKSKIKSILKVILATLIHYSSILLLLVFPFIKKNWSLKKYLSWLSYAILIAFIFKVLILGYIEKLDVTQSNYILWKIKYYLTYYDTEGYNYQGNLHKILLFIMNNSFYYLNILINLMYLNRFEYNKISKFTQNILNSQVIGTLLATFLYIVGASTLANRFLFSFAIGNFILLKDIMTDNNRNSAKERYMIFLIILVFINFIIILYYAGIHDPNSRFYIAF